MTKVSWIHFSHFFYLNLKEMRQDKWELWLSISCILLIFGFLLLINPVTQTVLFVKLLFGLIIGNLFHCIYVGVHTDYDDEDNLTPS